jgi:hypothetical protein
LVTASFVKLPDDAQLVGDLGMSIELKGKRQYAFVFDSGARFTATMMAVPWTGPNAWTIEERKPNPGGMPPMDFHQWSGDRLFDGVPRTGAEAPEVIFVPELDEWSRHGAARLVLGAGFFKLSRCE